MIIWNRCMEDHIISWLSCARCCKRIMCVFKQCITLKQTVRMWRAGFNPAEGRKKSKVKTCQHEMMQPRSSS